jgi:formate/nitrite transporter FocA (FNT family)
VRNETLAAGAGLVITIAILNASSAVLTITDGELTGGAWSGSPPVPGATLATGFTSFVNAGQSLFEQVGGYMSLTPAGGGEVSLSWDWCPGQSLLADGNVFGTSALLLTYTVTGVSTFQPTVTYVITDAGSAGESR